MNKELVTIIEALINRVEIKSHSGLVFIETKPELCKIVRFKNVEKGCYKTISCKNCYFYRSHNLQGVYIHYLENLIQRF